MFCCDSKLSNVQFHLNYTAFMTWDKWFHWQHTQLHRLFFIQSNTFQTSNKVLRVFPEGDNLPITSDDPHNIFTVTFGHNRFPCSMISRATMNRLKLDYWCVFVIESSLQPKEASGCFFVPWFPLKVSTKQEDIVSANTFMYPHS